MRARDPGAAPPRSSRRPGDNQRDVDAVAGEVGIAEAHGDLSPEAKVASVHRLVKSGERVVMVAEAGDAHQPAYGPARSPDALRTAGAGRGDRAGRG